MALHPTPPASLVRPQPSEAQVRREITQPPVAPVAEKKETVRIFWMAESGAALEPVEMELALPAEPEARAKHILLTLIASAPKPEARIARRPRGFDWHLRAARPSRTRRIASRCLAATCALTRLAVPGTLEQVFTTGDDLCEPTDARPTRCAW